MQRKDHLDLFGTLVLLACCAFWGLQQVLVKATIAEIAPAFQASLRFLGATVCLLIWCCWRGIALFKRDGTGRGGLLAGLLFTGELGCAFVGLQYGSAARVTVLLYTSPIWVALFLPLLDKTERLRPIQWLGLLGAFAAIAYMLRSGLHTNSTPGALWGDLLGLAAGMFWGLTTLVIRSSKLSQASAEKLLFYQIGTCAVLLPFLSWALQEPWHVQFSAFAWTSLALQITVGAFASYLAWMWMLGYYPATKMSAFAFTTPVFALLFAAIGLQETVNAEVLLTLAAVVIGIFLVNKKARPSN